MGEIHERGEQSSFNESLVGFSIKDSIGSKHSFPGLYLFVHHYRCGLVVTDGFAINPDAPGWIDSNYTGAPGKLLSNRLSYPRNY